MSPRDLLPHALLHHAAENGDIFGGEKLRVFLLQLGDDIAEQPEVSVLIAVDVADLLR